MSKMRSPKFLLVLAVLVLLASFPLLKNTQESKKNSYYDSQLAAAQKMQDLMAAVNQYKIDNNLVINEEDKMASGLIGERYSGITTTLGDPAAKRTVCQPDMAALLVRMFKEAGIEKGDKVAASMTGSFPGLNLALFAASDVLELDLRYISSIGASMYGANDEALTFPEIAYRLFQDGYISTAPIAISMGGDRDMGDEMFAPSREKVRERVSKLPVFYLEEGDFAKNLEKRRELYGKESEIDCFLSIGGHTSSLGHDERALDLGQGVLLKKGQPTNQLAAFKTRRTNKTGLLQYYLGQGTAVINLLNIKRICSSYSLPFDPREAQEVLGVSPVYYQKTYNRPLIYITLALTLALLAVYVISNRRA